MRLTLGPLALDVGAGSPVLMGIVNATPDSFSDPQGRKDTGLLADHALELVEQGAAIIDVGGESGRTDREAVSEEEEAARIAPLVERLAGQGVAVSVDTWRPGPARAALEAGAAMVNDVSGLADPVLADLCAQWGAGLVVTHTRTPPKTKAFPGYGDVLADVAGLLGERLDAARAAGVAEEALLVDPGLDLAKTPAESVEVLRRLPELYPLGRPLLMAISRKDFVGALTGRPPRRRDPGTLGAVEPALDAPGAVLRVHDVAGVRDFIAVRAALRGEAEVPGGPLEEGLRRERPAQGTGPRRPNG